MTILNRDKAYDNAFNNLNEIIISVPGFSIKGTLQEQIKYGVESNYNQIMSLDSAVPALNNFVNMTTNHSLFTAGIASRRYYKGGSYLKLSPKIRVMDWDGDGIVVDSAAFLMNLCLPSLENLKADHAAGAALSNAANTLATGFRDLKKGSVAKTAIATIGAAIGASTTDNPITGAIIGGVVTGAISVTKVGDRAFNNAASIANQLINQSITNNPQPVTIQISNYITIPNMLIESVEVEFSKEMTDFGPLYADISLVMGSRDVALRNQHGLENSTRNPNRFQSK